MRKKYLLLIFIIGIIVSGKLCYIVSNKTKSVTANIKKEQILANMSIQLEKNNDALYDDNFRSISESEYDIKTGKIKVNGEIYTIEVAEDGVLLIYNVSNELVASSKEALPEDETSIDYLSHYGDPSREESTSEGDAASTDSQLNTNETLNTSNKGTNGNQRS